MRVRRRVKQKGEPPKDTSYLFQKGKSGNPSGRPRGSVSLTSLMRERLQGVPALDKRNKFKSLAAEVIESIAVESAAGNYEFVRLLFDYIESPKMTAEACMAEIERIYTIICRHVKDPATLRAIATDLQVTET